MQCFAVLYRAKIMLIWYDIQNGSLEGLGKEIVLLMLSAP